jgi:hypothetical protein
MRLSHGPLEVFDVSRAEVRVADGCAGTSVVPDITFSQRAIDKNLHRGPSGANTRDVWLCCLPAFRLR